MTEPILNTGWRPRIGGGGHSRFPKMNCPALQDEVFSLYEVLFPLYIHSFILYNNDYAAASKNRRRNCRTCKPKN
jgi:hypothetical protein